MLALWRFRCLVLLLWLAAFGLALAQPLRFGVIGDSGSGDARQAAVARQMEQFHAKRNWEFVLMLGDNIYEDGNPRYFDRKFKNVYANLMKAGVRFHAVLGNHDRVHPQSRMGMAQVEDDAFGYVGRKDEYVLVAGPKVGDKRLARFIALNSGAWIEEIGNPERIGVRLARLRRWLEDSGEYQWNVLFLHQPLYSLVVSRRSYFGPLRGYGHGPEMALRRLLEPEIRGKIDVVLSGHEHFYQKIHPQHGVHYFISGGGARVRRGAVRKHPQVAFAAEVLHFLDMELTEKELRYAAISVQGAQIHAGRITK